VERWLEQGWLDYLTPQLYWPRQQPGQPFGVLLDYWAKQNVTKRHLWPGLFVSAINDTPRSWSAGEILGQIDLVRDEARAGGHVHFSMVALMQDRNGVAGKLLAGPYASAALVPATPWLGTAPPAAPQWQRRPDGQVRIVPAPGIPAAKFAVWRRQGAGWKFSVQSAGETVIEAQGAEAIAVSAVDRLGNESPRVILRLTAAGLRP
jgi:hypothetical protein